MHLKISTFPGRTSPAVLVRNPNHDSYRYSDEAGAGFVYAAIDQQSDGAFRLHLYKSGRKCFYIAQSETIAGDYRQIELSPYNLDILLPSVTVSEADESEAGHQLDDVAEKESLLLERSTIASSVCQKCPQQGGFKNMFSVHCEKSPASCGCISLLRGTCPEGRWTESLLSAGKISTLDISGDLSVDQVRQLIRSGFDRWPANFTKMPNVQYAYRAEMKAFVPPVIHSGKGRGIAILGGGRYFDSAYVTIRMIRHTGCTLPIELWYLGEREMKPWQRKAVEPYDVVARDLHELAPGVKGWPAKSIVLAESSFAELLFLDADAYPIRDPEFLFDLPSYRETGAIFWPDIPDYDLKPDVYDVLGMTFVKEPDFESGMIVVNRMRCYREIGLARWINQHSDFYYKLWHGDKATFHIAWRYLGSDYAMPAKRPLWEKPALVQHDFDGNPLFVHRVAAKLALEDKTGTGWFAATGQVPKAEKRNDKLPLEDVAYGYLEELRAVRSKGSLAIVHLGRNGDALVMKPALEEIAKHRDVKVIFRLPYIQSLDGFPHHVFAGDETEWAKAEKIGWEIADECWVTQFGYNPAPTKYDNWAHETWHRLGMAHEDFNRLPLEITNRDLAGEQMLFNTIVKKYDKPIILINMNGHGAPYRDGDQLVEWVRHRYPDHQVIDLGKIKAPSFISLFGLYEMADLLISVDTGTLHLSYATRRDGSLRLGRQVNGTRIPTVALVSDIPAGRSPNRPHWIERLTYTESRTPIGYDRIARAMDSIVGKRAAA